MPDTFHAPPEDVAADDPRFTFDAAGVELERTGDGLVLTPGEARLLDLATGRVDMALAVDSDVIADRVVTALERLGRLTARNLERLAERPAGEDLDLEPEDAARHAWRIVIAELTAGDAGGGNGRDLEAAVGAFVKLDAYNRHRIDYRDEVLEERDAAREALGNALARDARLERLIATLLEGARQAGGLDAFTGRYEGVGIALKSLEAAVSQP